ncbi:glutathione S-transferase 1-like [Triticum aestivum]|uniref:glutathione S-transferase 1-like n=1 Tax=Triticum aestivum TaxID=4565 RepID=UPI001D02947C|nr:glutathione S-transferase 1-like [Triticum aestivum]
MVLHLELEVEDLEVGRGVVSFPAREDGRHHKMIRLGLGSGLACCAPGCGPVVVAELQLLAVPIHARAIIIVRWVYGGGARQQAAGGDGASGRQHQGLDRDLKSLRGVDVVSQPTESRAIARYILRKYRTPGSPDLLGENGGANGATMVDVWTEVEAQQYHPAISPVVFECIIFPVMRGAATDQKFVDESLERLRGVLGTYEERLSESRYLAGDSFSFADLNHFPFTFYFMATPYAALFDEYPRVKAWWEDLMARPSVKRVCANMPTKF